MNIYPKPFALAGVLCSYVSCVFQWRNLASLSACTSGPANETRLEVRKDSRWLPVMSLCQTLLTLMMKGSQSIFHSWEEPRAGCLFAFSGKTAMVLITKEFWVQCQWIGPFHFNKKLIRSRTDITRTETHSLLKKTKIKCYGFISLHPEVNFQIPRERTKGQVGTQGLFHCAQQSRATSLWFRPGGGGLWL